VWPNKERLTYSPIVNGILESEACKIAGPRTPAMGHRHFKKNQKIQFFAKCKMGTNISKKNQKISNLKKNLAIMLQFFAKCKMGHQHFKKKIKKFKI